MASWQDCKRAARWQAGKMASWKSWKIASWQAGKLEAGRAGRLQELAWNGKLQELQDGKLARWQAGGAGKLEEQDAYQDTYNTYMHTYTHMHAHILYIIHVMIDAGCWMLDAKGIAPAMVTMRRRDCKSHSISHSIVYSIVYDIVYTIIYAISLCYLQHFCTTRSVLNSIYNTFASQSGF